MSVQQNLCLHNQFANKENSTIYLNNRRMNSSINKFGKDKTNNNIKSNPVLKPQKPQITNFPQHVMDHEEKILLHLINLINIDPSPV